MQFIIAICYRIGTSVMFSYIIIARFCFFNEFVTHPAIMDLQFSFKCTALTIVIVQALSKMIRH